MFDRKFYFFLMRKYTVAFGTLFNNIYVQHYTPDGESLKERRVPVKYGPKKHWVQKIRTDKRFSDTNGNNILSIGQSLPIISFFITSITPDSTRNTSELIKFKKTNIDDPDILKVINNPVPYKFGYTVSILHKKMDIGTQIIEQILPYFQPTVNVPIYEIKELDIKRDVPITIDGTNPEFSIDYGEEDDSIYSWDISFNLDGYLYKPIDDAKIIKKIKTYLTDDNTFRTYHTMTEWDVAPITADKDDNYTINQTTTYEGGVR